MLHIVIGFITIFLSSFLFILGLGMIIAVTGYETIYTRIAGWIFVIFSFILEINGLFILIDNGISNYILFTIGLVILLISYYVIKFIKNDNIISDTFASLACSSFLILISTSTIAIII